MEETHIRRIARNFIAMEMLASKREFNFSNTRDLPRLDLQKRIRGEVRSYIIFYIPEEERPKYRANLDEISQSAFDEVVQQRIADDIRRLYNPTAGEKLFDAYITLLNDEKMSNDVVFHSLCLLLSDDTPQLSDRDIDVVVPLTEKKRIDVAIRFFAYVLEFFHTSDDDRLELATYYELSDTATYLDIAKKHYGES